MNLWAKFKSWIADRRHHRVCVRCGSKVWLHPGTGHWVDRVAGLPGHVCLEGKYHVI